MIAYWAREDTSGSVGCCDELQQGDHHSAELMSVILEFILNKK